MYDSAQVLAAIDRHWVAILILCGGAMVCNYIWFVAAVLRGVRDATYPMPIVSVLFWLTGDASVVIRWLTGHNAYDHWYLRLFSLSLTLTVACEIVFLGMVLKYGRREWLPDQPPVAFAALVFAGLGIMVICWDYLAGAMNDPLNITYFFLANMIGPPASAALALRRRSHIGTSPLIWVGYAAMLCFFYAACFSFYGHPFDSGKILAFYAVNVLAAIATALLVRRLPSSEPGTN